MPHFSTRTVTAVRAEREGLQKVDVDGEPAYVLTRLTGPVAVGDRVVVNTTAVDLGLGSGGWHVVHWNLERTSWSEPGGGRGMKLRYTSPQADVGAAEEQARSSDTVALGGTPVVACTLHSQVGCVAAAFGRCAPGRSLTYVMTDSAALPLALSDLVADLRERRLLASTVTCGQAFGGEYEAVTVASALELAVGSLQAEAVVVGPGPGVVGTDSRFGFSGLEVAGVLDTAATLGGEAVVAVRYSDADPRERHRGISHHTRTSLAMAARPVKVPIPASEPRPADLGQVVEVELPADLDYGGLTTMGRGVGEDPGFFRYAAAAGVLAAQLLG